MKKRILSWLLVLAMVVSLIPSTLVTAFAANVANFQYAATYNVADLNAATAFENGKVYKLIGGGGTTPVRIKANTEVTIVLDNVTIESTTSPIQVEAGAKLTLIARVNTTNVLTCTSDTAQKVTDNNASGLTAGISVPEGATLVIDKDDGGDGTLTVTGGYGGAGIGSSAKVTLRDDLRGNSGAGGTTGSAGHEYAQPSGAAGAGGQGGRYGTDTQNAGSITINGSVLNAAGGTGGAGIGGGLGGAGEAGENGVVGSQGNRGNAWDNNRRIQTNGASGGSGAGGNGGNGGSGGNGGDVRITGGRITAVGGTGGSAVAGTYGLRRQVGVNYWKDAFYTNGTGGAGGAGEGGYGGRGGSGGDAGTLSITGGYVSASGTVGFGPGAVGADGAKGSGTRTNGSVGEWSYVEWAAHNDWGTRQNNGTYVYWAPGNGLWCFYGTATTGGNGGAASAQASPNGSGANGTLTITGSTNNVDFVSNGGGSLTNGRPADKNGEQLYRVELTIYDLQKDSKIKDASVNVDVPAANGKTGYTYTTVSEMNGKAVLWLPAGEYVLREKAVNHATLGAIPKDSPVTLTVADNDNNKQDVMIGVSVKVSLDKTDKVYFSQDSETPVKLLVDTSEIDQKISSVKWFRENVNDNEQEYAVSDTGNKKSFNEKYDKMADDSGNKGTLTNPTDNVYSLPINQNGRYWVEIEYQSNGVNVQLVKGLTVSNIFRTYEIQFRSIWQESVGQGGQQKQIVMQVPADGSYGKLLDSQGKEMRQQVGFAWDLDGYNATDIGQGTLLKAPHDGFDTVKFYAQSSQLSYNTAALGTYSGFTKDSLVFEKTLNGEFLSNQNTDCDQVDGQPDYSKYTITYELKDSNLTLVTIYGRVQKDGVIDRDSDPLYTSQRAYSPIITEDNIKASPWTGYKLVGVYVNGKPAEFVKDAEGNNTDVLALEYIQGDVDLNKEKVRTVEFIYENNMTDVTIHGYYQGTTDKVFDDITVSAEIGTSFTYPQPVISNHDNAGATPDGGTIASVTEGAEITFYYLHSTGNVTYVAQDADGNTPLASKTITVKNGGAIDKSAAKAAEVLGTIPYYTLNGDGTATADTYNGKDDVTVTYTYRRNTHKLTVIKKDVDSGNEITGAQQEIENVPAGKTYTFGDTVTAVQDYTAVAALNPTSFDMGDADATVTFWYRKNDANRYATVTVNSVCDEDKDGIAEVFQSYQIPAFKDVELNVPAPTWTGYELKDKTVTSQKITPTGDAQHDTVTFEYVLDNPRTITVELNNNTEGGTFTVPGYKTEYVLKKGDTVTIQAPVINGYSLVGTSTVTVKYDDAEPADNKVVFNYAAVKTANFVTHTIVFKNHNETFEFYRYSTLVTKSDTDTTTYNAKDVQNVIAGYKLQDIRMKIEGDTGDTTNETSVTAPNNKNVEIVYRFKEDTARIVIKKELSDGTTVADTVLSGYREGLTDVEVTAPLVDGYALASDQPLTKKLGTLTSGDNEITFKYDKVGNVTFTLKEHNDATGKDETIVVRNGEANKTYDPNAAGNPLNLSADKYTFLANEEATPPFNTADGKIENLTTEPARNYDVYYTKGTRSVTFIAVDSAKYPQPTDMTQFDADQAMAAKIAERPLTERARIGEMYKASAQSVDLYALDDQVSKYYTVDDSEGTLYVYFWYKAKSVGTVTVHYHTGLTADNHDKAELLLSYSMEAVVGEKVIVNLPQYLMGGKYKLPADTATTQTVIVEANGNTVDINYESNFVTVNVKTKRSDAAEAAEYASHEVNKTDATGKVTGNLTLTPPYREGYTLVGITGVTGGSATSFPDSYQNGKLTLTGLTHDTIITYHYNKTSATEYQSDLTIEYKYNGYDLAASKTVKANLGEANTIDVPTFEGYKAKTYQFTDGTTAGQETDITTTSISITPTQKAGTLVITYIRPDGSVVLPGEDGKFPAPEDKDNVIVKPGDGTTIEGPKDDGSVKIPEDGTGTVTRPDPDNKPDGKEDIKVPGGTVIKPDGTIELPGGGEIKPGDKIPDNLPADYIAITYIANNGTGEIVKEIGKKNELKVRGGDVFNAAGKATFVSWNDNGSGNGMTYNAGDTVSKSTTLYAQWNTKYTFSATVIYKPNGGTPEADVPQTVGNDADSNLIAVVAHNTFFEVEGWNFGGWNEDAAGNGKLYQPNAKLTMNNGSTQTLFAQWYKVNADGSITVPGKDGNPNTAGDNATANGNGTENPKRDETTGNIEVPKGGSVTLPDGTVIGMPDGGILKPDGTVIINRPGGGTITIPGKDDKNPDITKPDGSEDNDAEIVTMIYHSNDGEKNPDQTVTVKAVKGDEISIIANPFKWDGYTFLNWVGTNKQSYAPAAKFTAEDMEFFAQWAKKNDTDGSIELPGKDGAIEPPDDKDNVIVKPGEGTTIEGPRDDGSVKIPEDGTGTVIRPDPTDPDYPEGGKEEIKVPGGTIILPDGTIILPEPQPNGTIIKPDDKIDEDSNLGDYFVVTFLKGEAETGDPIKLIVKAGTIKLLAENAFAAPTGKMFIGWKTGDETLDAETDYAVTKNVTFTAQFKKIQIGKAVVTFDFNGGTADGKTYETRTGNPGEKLGKLPEPTRSGYTFDGWNEPITEDTPFGEENSTTTYTAQWTAISYTISYNGNGATGNVADQNYTFDTVGATLAQNGFTMADKVFLGWSTDANATSAMFGEGEAIGDAIRAILTNPDVTINNTLTLYAVWKDNQVVPSAAVAIFDFAGGHDANGNTSVRKTGEAETAITINDPTREGYTFAGWDNADLKFGKAGTVTVFTAQWTAIQYTVSFRAGANGTMQGDASVLVDYNSPITADKIPTITANNGYVFVGWSDGTSVFAADALQNYVVTGNVTFTAQYENISKAIAIFDYNGGKDADGKSSITMTGVAGEEITIQSPTREGYTFAGWDNADLKFGVAGSITVFTAQWTANKLTVTFDVGDDTKGEMNGTATVQVDYNGTVDQIPTITATAGFMFIGWSDGKSVYSEQAIRDYKVTSDVTFTAQYEDNSKAVVILNYAGGVDGAGRSSITMTGNAGETVTVDENPSREGYTFAGWSSDDLKFGAAGTVTEFTAQWTIETFTVNFEAGAHGTMTGNDSVQVEYNGSVAENEIPTISADEGFVFIGWSDGNSTYAAAAIKNYVVTGNVTFTAQYEEVNKAIAIFDYAGGKDADGKSSIMMTGVAAAEITITAPTRKGYTFEGWKNEETTTQNPTFGAAGSVTTYTAVWTENPDETFKVNFVVDTSKGSVTGTTEFDVVYGGFVTEVPTVKAKEGYTFIGWSDGKNTYFTAGVKLYAITEPTTFTALFEKGDPNIPNPPVKDTLTVTSEKNTAKRGEKVSFKAWLNDTQTDDVTWTVSGSKSTISETGVLTVGSTETNGTILTITATSKSDPTLTASKTIVVVVSGGSSGGGGNNGGNNGNNGGNNNGGNTTRPADPTETGVAKWLETTVHNAYMSGVGAGRFEPNANMTRAQVAQMFYNLLLDKRITVTASFSDVPSGKWYTEAVNALASLGIIQGSNGKFRPNDPITRAEFVTIAMRFAGKVSGARASFTDVPASAWYYDSIASAVAYGWIGGYSDGSFRPTKSITRAEVVTIVNRMLARSFDSSVRLNDVTNFSDVPVTHWAFGAISEATTSHDHTVNNGVESWR